MLTGNFLTVTRAVKVGHNPWINPVHHVFGSGRITVKSYNRSNFTHLSNPKSNHSLVFNYEQPP